MGALRSSMCFQRRFDMRSLTTSTALRRVLLVTSFIAGLMMLLSVPHDVTAGPTYSTLYTYYNCTPGNHWVTGEREYDCDLNLIYSWGTTTDCYFVNSTCTE